MTDWATFFSSCTEEELGGIALLRMIECTNGCIQHAFRENDARALPAEETRTAMKYSMGLMKEVSFQLGTEKYIFSEKTEEGLREIRELYVKAFKQGNEEAMENFFSSSYACVEALGETRIRDAAKTVRQLLTETFPEHTISWGENYLLNLLSLAASKGR